MRIGFAVALPPIVTPDSTGRYESLGRNLAEGNGFTMSSAPPYRPDALNQPLYPALLAGLQLVAGGDRSVVVVAQLLIELLTVLLVAALATRARITPLGRTAVIVAALLCPIMPTVARAIWSETLATALIVLTVFFALRAVRAGRALDFALAGLAAALGLLTRADMAPALVLVAIVGGVALWRYRPPGALRGVALVLVAAAIPMGLWMARNQADFGKLQPLGGYVGQLENTYQRWLGTWLDDLDDMAPYWWYVGTRGYPTTFPEKVVDPVERERANGFLALGKAGLGSPEAKAAFAELAARASDERPLRTHLWVPAKRLVNLWLNMTSYMPRSPLRSVATAGWVVFLALSLAGLVWGAWKRDALAFFMLAIVAGRSVLPLFIGIACEPRYVVEALPACFIGFGYFVTFVVSRWRRPGLAAV